MQNEHKDKEKIDRALNESTVLASANSVLEADKTPLVASAPAEASVAQASGSPSGEPTASLASATSDLVSKGRTPMASILGLLPVDKQAEGGALLLDLMRQAREEGVPIDASKSSLALARGKKYRRSNRQPKEDNADENRRS